MAAISASRLRRAAFAAIACTAILLPAAARADGHGGWHGGGWHGGGWHHGGWGWGPSWGFGVTIPVPIYPAPGYPVPAYPPAYPYPAYPAPYGYAPYPGYAPHYVPGYRNWAGVWVPGHWQ